MYQAYIWEKINTSSLNFRPLTQLENLNCHSVHIPGDKNLLLSSLPTGMFGARWPMLLSIPYIVLPFWIGYKLLKQPRDGVQYYQQVNILMVIISIQYTSGQKG